ncbi:MAG TPA: LacI family DNA-binding transcriptional regulator [Terriglobales bacterium]|nr:LacI family DNA-binding transcriptional regulator [Terriglobales bacterium]
MSTTATTTKRDEASTGPNQRVSLKSIAKQLGLSTTTVSVVVNDAPAAKAISQETKDRILKVAQELNYRPNYFARSLRQKRSFMVAMILPEISEGYAASIMRGIEDRLLLEGYLYFVVSHRGKADLVEEYAHLLIERGVEGLICVNTPLNASLPVPVVAVSGERNVPGVTNIAIDNRKAVRLAMEHLAALGHKRIAFFKGHAGSADTEYRWEGICKTAQKLGVPVLPELTIQLQGSHRGGGEEPSTPDEGYVHGKKLLERNEPFTALLAFNDMSAIGAMRAFQDHGLRVPQDVSIIGFDDIQAASFQNPRLTTVRQPMRRMGELAAVTLLKRINNPEEEQKSVRVQPELIVRESTAKVGR